MLSNDLGSLELKHLVALRAVAQARSFGRAAQHLGYTQSAISQQIAALERIVGEPLFDRPGGPKPVELTRAGELLLEHADAILERVRAAEADLAGYRAGQVGRLAIGTFQSVSVQVLPELLRRLRDERPDVEVSLFEEDDQAVLLMKALVEGELDLTFAVGPIEPDVAEFIPLAVDPFIIMSPVDDPLVGPGEPVSASTLNGLPLIGQTLNACQVILEDGMRQVGVEPNVFFRTGDNSAVQAMVRSGMGHAVMARLAIDPEDPGVSVHDIDPPIPPRIIGIALPDRARPPVVDAVIDIARDVCAQIMPTPVAVA